MAKKTSYGGHRRSNKALSALITLLLAIAVLCVMLVLDLAGIRDFFSFNNAKPSYTVSGGTVEMHVINMGQGDCILFMAPEGNILFDAGKDTKASEGAIKTYLDGLGIEKLDYLILTHPDEDHIGGADMIINTYSVGTVLMEEYTYGSFTEQYSDLVNALEEKDLTPIDPSLDDEYSIGDLHMKVLGPISTSSGKNDNSIVVRLDFGESSFLMTGDAEFKAENEILARYGSAELDCDVLKVGHHGGNTSSGAEFLAAITPDISLISCKANNSYGHPTKEVLNRLNAVGTTIYRTDLHGSIVLRTDGVDISVDLPEDKQDMTS